MSHPFPAGTKVETNEEYFKQFGRKVIGESTIIDNNYTQVTIIRWDYQEGNIIPEHNGNNVLMMTSDLQNYESR